jgi:lysophospholipase L1-like esterase
MTARGRLLSGLVTTVMALAGFVTAGALPAGATASPVQYVALGDSYAAGAGAPPYKSVSLGDKICIQSIESGYPVLLDARGRIDLPEKDNATCPGFTTTDVANNLPSRLDEHTRLVTLTVGGNDVGFAGLAGTCTTATTPEEQRACIGAINDAVDLLPDLGIHLTHLYGQVADKSPDALIVVTGYPYLFESNPDNPIITAFNKATAALNTTIEDAVNATRKTGVDIIYVDVTTAFATHGIGCQERGCLFINPPGSGVPGAVPFHPNAAGYNAYADAISDVLPNGWLDKTSRKAASS